MLKSFLPELLIDPVTAAPLRVNDSGNALTDGDLRTYPIKENVPIILDHDTSKHSGFSYAEHYEKDAEVTDYFEEENAATADERRRSRQTIIKAVAADAKLILDIGCGSAWVAEGFTTKGVKVISSDISLINPAKALKKIDNENHAALTADVYHLPIRPGTVDTVIASEVLEHVPDPALFITKLLTVLKPGGQLIMLTPYNEKIVQHLCIHCNMQTPANAHLHSFNENNIRAVIPAGVKYKTDRFNNKYLVKLRVYSLLSFLPHSFWKLTDSVANKLFKKPSLFLIVITK